MQGETRHIAPADLRSEMSHSTRFADQTLVLRDSGSIPVEIDNALKPCGIKRIRTASPRRLKPHRDRRERWLDVSVHVVTL